MKYGVKGSISQRLNIPSVWILFDTEPDFSEMPDIDSAEFCERQAHFNKAGEEIF